MQAVFNVHTVRFSPAFLNFVSSQKEKKILRGMETFTHVSELNLVTKGKEVFVIDLRS